METAARAQLKVKATVETRGGDTIPTGGYNGPLFGEGIQDALPAALQALERADGDAEGERGVGQVRLFSARAEFPEAWRTFVAAGTGDGGADLELDLSEDRFPHPEEPKTRTIEFIAAFVRFAPESWWMQATPICLPPPPAFAPREPHINDKRDDYETKR